MSADLLSVEDMAEIPTESGAGSGRGSSKGVNLFLARQKLIADMMEQEEMGEEEGQADEEKVVHPMVCGPRNEKFSEASRKSEGKKLATSICLETQEMSSDYQLLNIEDMSEIPHSTEQKPAGTGIGGARSKGANLFLARQKLIADMMAAEEEAEKAAEEAKRVAEEEKIRQAELERQQELERQRLEEIKRKEEEKLIASERAKAARAARFKTISPPVEENEGDIPWVKKSNKPKETSGAQRKTLYQLLSADKK